MSKPLPELLRPQVLDDVVGQQHLLGKGGPLRRLIENEHLPSIIFWGPPGVGKTTLAYILARHFGYKFVELSGVDFSIKSLESIKPSNLAKQKPTLFDEPPVVDEGGGEGGPKPVVVFIDEIHRLNKSQQAQFLPYVERGDWILIGATTENPSFEVIAPLLSRAQVLVLKALQPQDLEKILAKAIKFIQQYLPHFKLDKKVSQYLLTIANGDARLLLNALQVLAKMYPGADRSTTEEKLTVKQVKEALGNLHLVYDKHGEEHYDTISALHKSMRGSDPNAAVYYLGRMLEGGEKPEYIARRCVRFAAEDIGNADPQALILANAAFDAVLKVGMPESDVILSQLVIYLAQAPKSNTAYTAYKKVQADIRQYGNLAIPLKIRNAPTQLMDDLGYGEGYKYPHDFAPGELEGETYLPDELVGREYI